MKNFRCRLYVLVFLLIALFLCSCGGSSKPEQSGDISTNANVDVGIDLGNETASAGSNGTPVIDDNSNPIVVRVESQEEVYPFAEETFIKSIARVESTLLLLADEDNTGRLGLTEYTILEDGHPTISDVKELNISPLPFEGEPIMYAVAAGNDGNFYLLAGNNINNASTILVVQRYNRAGEYIDCMEIPDWDLLTVDVFSVGSNGEFVLAVDDTICVYRWADGLLERHSGEFRVYSSSMSGAGLIVSTFSTVNHKGQYSLINCETGALENLSLSEDDPSGNTSMLLYRVCGSVASRF